MAWIESHQELGRHPKLIRLARKLGVSKPAAVGHLQYLWWWAMDFAEDGDLSGMDPAEIAEAAEWNGDPQEFFCALVDVGFLDVHDDTLLIHDWHDYAGRLIQKRHANAQRMRKARASHVQDTNHARAGATVPNRTQPEPHQTVPNPEEESDGDSERGGAAAAAPRAPSSSRHPPEVSQDFREQMRREFGPVLGDREVGHAINLALAHESALKYRSNSGFEEHVRKWLKRDANQASSQPRASPNGRNRSDSRQSRPSSNLEEYRQRRGHLPWEDQPNDSSGERESVEPGDS